MKLNTPGKPGMSGVGPGFGRCWIRSGDLMFHPRVLGWLQNLPESTGDRIQAVAAFLDAPGDDALRGQIGNWVTRLIPTEALVPQAYQRWRPLVQDAMEFVFSRLSSRRLAAKMVEQFELPADTPP